MFPTMMRLRTAGIVGAATLLFGSGARGRGMLGEEGGFTYMKKESVLPNGPGADQPGSRRPSARPGLSTPAGAGPSPEAWRHLRLLAPAPPRTSSGPSRAGTRAINPKNETVTA